LRSEQKKTTITRRKPKTGKKKIDKKRISRENQRTSRENQKAGREKHHDQVVPQQISEGRIE
jgi:hypothetical protein